jgi:SWI/SNF related-matrix-associated actin-dependent regulator of chromatin subfamily C
MDDDSMNFGSDGAGATPGSTSILTQPPLHGESTPSGPQSSSGLGEGQLEGIFIHQYLDPQGN